MAARLDGLIISEILADNPSTEGFDTDGDGGADKSDEFIEIQNTTGAAISLDGYQLWSEKGGLLYAFGPGATVGAGETATVVGEYAGTPPAGWFDAGAAPGTDWLADGEGTQHDSVFLVNAATGDYIVLSYGLPPRVPTLPPGFTGSREVGAESIASGAPNGTAIARDGSGALVEAPPTPGTPGVPCYAPGSLIDTPQGARPVETLRPGMTVRTVDRGAARLLWVRAGAAPAGARPDGAVPILLRAGALGPGRPAHDLVVSPQHRILVGARGQLDRLFARECLVPAKALAGLPGIRALHGATPVRWVHFALRRHEIVLANGCAAESLLLGPVVLGQLSRTQRRALLRIFGPPGPNGTTLNGPLVRPCLTVRAARAVIAHSPVLLAAADAMPAGTPPRVPRDCPRIVQEPRL